MEGARDAHSECHIFRSREEIKIVHSCGFKRWTESKELRVAGSGSMWGRRLRERDLSDGTGCLEGHEVLVTGVRLWRGLCTAGGVARASTSGSKPLSPGEFMKFPLIFFLSAPCYVTRCSECCPVLLSTFACDSCSRMSLSQTPGHRSRPGNEN